MEEEILDKTEKVIREGLYVGNSGEIYYISGREKAWHLRSSIGRAGLLEQDEAKCLLRLEDPLGYVKRHTGRAAFILEMIRISGRKLETKVETAAIVKQG